MALAGPGAYLYGEAVLGMLGLCPVNPTYIHIATPRRTRRALPDYLRAVVHTSGAVYDGIPCQRIADVIRAAFHVLPELLASAASRACEEGHLTCAEHDAIVEELGTRT